MTQTKKLIEVALPLDEINAACVHEKMPGIGAHPRGLHLWWARRPLAAARAVADLMTQLGPLAEQARNLAYRLYTSCERKKWADEARAYNGLVLAWPELQKLAASGTQEAKTENQEELFG